jgi:uncharacterized membrane protein
MHVLLVALVILLVGAGLLAYACCRMSVTSRRLDPAPPPASPLHGGRLSAAERRLRRELRYWERRDRELRNRRILRGLVSPEPRRKGR